MSVLIQYTTCNINSVVHAIFNTHPTKVNKTLMDDAKILKVVDNESPPDVLRHLINRDWHTTDETFIGLNYQYHFSLNPKNQTTTLIVLTLDEHGNRCIELVARHMSNLDPVTYTIFSGTKAAEDYYIDVADVDGCPHVYLTTGIDIKGRGIIAPLESGNVFSSTRAKGLNPRLNQLLDVEHLDTSDNQSLMYDVVDRLVNKITWKERAFTDRIYYHRAKVEGDHQTCITLVLFPDRTKLVYVRRLIDWDDDHLPKTYIGINKCGKDAMKFLNDMGLTYDRRANNFKNKDIK